MNAKPIPFRSPMIRALIDGRKTQTRRVVRVDKIKPSHWDHAMIGAFRFLERLGFWQARAGQYNVWSSAVPHIHAVGDRLWVREAWSHTGTGVWTIANARMVGRGGVIYRADDDKPGARWFPSIHMPREFSRLTLIVTDVRVQRLAEISSADAIAEGCAPYANSATIDCDTPDPRDDFRDLWNNINGPDAWERNDGVAAYTFTVHHCNVDAIADTESP